MLKVGIIVGSTREGRVSPQVAQWVLEKGKDRIDLALELVDIKDFELPFLGTADVPAIGQWKATIDRLDGFIFITAEYNHSIPASLKNALDLAKEEWANKPAGIVSYGSLGGARATEHLRGIVSELQMADVRSHTALSMFTDFEKWSVFKPSDVHLANLTSMFEQVSQWGNALKSIR